MRFEEMIAMMREEYLDYKSGNPSHEFKTYRCKEWNEQYRIRLFVGAPHAHGVPDVCAYGIWGDEAPIPADGPFDMERIFHPKWFEMIHYDWEVVE